ncbi:peptide/nickel transport system permease protein [Actinocorallia herbida]|uniref:Peptide/nickel transport system permease protein n=1 Tax=Actinocorallia herbida TaxID=58109 RepID=A0A3N1CUZ4_9ACTN|nr:ABC transporter permease [Actinocorallia herbida]ROO85123.1 peptide/nickel transport system permease protein [Actinocorallia herbida]
MTGHLLRRLPSLALVLLVSSVIAFALPRLAPGDPAAAIAGADASPRAVAEVRAELGLDRSLPAQYADWITGLGSGDFGTSFVNGRPAAELIASRLGSTVELAIVAAILMTVLGVGLGVLGGTPRGKVSRAVLDLTGSVLLAAPPFLTGLLLVLLLGIAFPVLPVSGEVSLLDDPGIGIQYLILPAVALALPQAAAIGRLVETAMRQARQEDYVDLAVAKGVPPGRVTWRHVLPNSLGTAVVAIGLRVGELLAGAIVVEAVFARNGLGALAVESVKNRDYLVIQALILGSVLVAALIQILTELLLTRLDPRVRLEAR